MVFTACKTNPAGIIMMLLPVGIAIFIKMSVRDSKWL